MSGAPCRRRTHQAAGRPPAGAAARLIGTSGSYEVIVFGIAIVLVLKYLPDGLWSLVARYLPDAPRKVDWQNATALPSAASRPAR
jgi:hypothetical protein